MSLSTLVGLFYKSALFLNLKLLATDFHLTSTENLGNSLQKCKFMLKKLLKTNNLLFIGRSLDFKQILQLAVA